MQVARGKPFVEELAKCRAAPSRMSLRGSIKSSCTRWWISGISDVTAAERGLVTQLMISGSHLPNDLSSSPGAVTLLTWSLAAVTVCTCVIAVCMAIWTWRTFRVSVFLWLVAARTAPVIAAMTEATQGASNMKSTVEAIQTQTKLGLYDLATVTACLSHLLPLLSSLGLLLIALGEFSHFGPRLVPTYEPRKWLVRLFSVRHLLGIFATLCGVLPSLVVQLWERSLR